jgi:hypothetical protein
VKFVDKPGRTQGVVLIEQGDKLIGSENAGQAKKNADFCAI